MATQESIQAEKRENRNLRKPKHLTSNDFLNSNQNVNDLDSKQNVQQQFLLPAPSLFRTSENDKGCTVNILSGSKPKEEYTYSHKCSNYLLRSSSMSTKKVSFRFFINTYRINKI